MTPPPAAWHNHTKRYVISMRTAQLNPISKEKLLDAAEELMLAKGFEATSVDEICAAARLTKGSFFHYFETKEVLAKAALERFCQRQQERMRSAPFHQKRDPLARLEGLFDFMAEMAKSQAAQRGCLLGIFSQELCETSSEIQACCAERFRDWAKGLQRMLDEAKEKHAPRAAVDTHSLAEHVIAVLEGSLILAKAKRDPKVVAEGLGHVKRYIQGVFGK